MKNSSTNDTKVKGEMTKKDSGTVGKMQAAALIIGVFLFGSAAVITSISLLL